MILDNRLVLGFTGTGLAEFLPLHRRALLKRFLSEELYAKRGYRILHHGDCIGADELCHEFADKCGYEIVIHPPVKPDKRAFCTPTEGEILEPYEYLTRNHHIVDSCDLLVAMPKVIGQEELRSGTWATVRYARKQGKLVEFV